MFQLVADHNRPILLSRRKKIGKRIFDLVVCAILIPLLLPILAMCGIAILIESPGPIIFRQWRTGKGGQRFRMFKFRTMVRNAEELKKDLMHLNELTAPDFKIFADPRITRVGGFLRRTSLDELPQIFNVLLADMSIVGPRPTSFRSETYSLDQTERLEVTPGITGLWQVSGRSEVDFDERVRLDAEYIRKQSFWFDLVIILRTFSAVFRQKGAC
ncbi:sugar transferase [Pirellulaceae bacterium]|nr:sugar transferase [Pirellulaceae bacterium]